MTTSESEAFSNALEAKDAERALAFIRSHPEFNTTIPQDADSLWDLIIHLCPELILPALQSGLHPDAPTSNQHQTLLQQLVCRNDLHLIEAAIAHGANLEAQNVEGETALGYAAAWAELPVVQLLIRAGANPNAIEQSPDGFESTALDACKNRPEIFAYLRSVGAKQVHELSKSPTSNIA